MKTRRSGILLHITSLPSAFGIGDLGWGAYRFADFLAACRQTIWQVLPLNPTFSVCGNSPYCSFSAFAGNAFLISPQRLVEDGFLAPSDIENHPDFPSERVSYGSVAQYKGELLSLACERFRNLSERKFGFDRFCSENARWLDDHALFVGLKGHFAGAVWTEWPSELRDRDEAALREWKERLADQIFLEKFTQYVFFSQWLALKDYCNALNIQIFGDIPIYVSFDSSDVWASSRIFKLDDRKRPTFVAGVPPDYFSATGQLWGNPVYDWDVLRERRYAWWVHRLEHNLKLFNLVRLDHFRGFISYWEVRAGEETAINGKWAEVPAEDFFDTLQRRFSHLPIVAEDLGTITPDVREIMNSYGFPGMKLLLFAFGDDLAKNPYVPHNHNRDSVVYTGTHDNNTIRGWFRREASEADKERLFKYIGRTLDEEGVHWELVRLAMMSVSSMAVIPMQDILGLGEEARMNLPAVTYGNWEWRVTQEQLTPALGERVLELTRLYGRA